MSHCPCLSLNRFRRLIVFIDTNRNGRVGDWERAVGAGDGEAEESSTGAGGSIDRGYLDRKYA